MEVLTWYFSSACGWYVLEVSDGDDNVSAIVSALRHADMHSGQPVFININTTIGHGTTIAGTNKAHHAAFGGDDVKACKTSWGYDPLATHVVPDDVRQYWSEIPNKGRRVWRAWRETVAQYTYRYPELGNKLAAFERGQLNSEWREKLLSIKPSQGKTPVRQSSGAVFDELWEVLPFFGGSADLSDPNFVLKTPKEIFGPQKDAFHQSYGGRYVHFGTREHGMAGISNGMAAYSARRDQKDGKFGQAIIPITATFSMFQLYAAPAIRMSALMKLQVIHMGTHDSIAEGACGPTHQVSFCSCKGTIC